MDKIEAHTELQAVTAGTDKEAPAASPTKKKPFVEPEISTPVDVLEATTFQTPSDSGPV